jgi:hypothetical protein
MRRCDHFDKDGKSSTVDSPDPPLRKPCIRVSHRIPSKYVLPDMDQLCEEESLRSEVEQDIVERLIERTLSNDGNVVNVTYKHAWTHPSATSHVR